MSEVRVKDDYLQLYTWGMSAQGCLDWSRPGDLRANSDRVVASKAYQGSRCQVGVPQKEY